MSQNIPQLQPPPAIEGLVETSRGAIFAHVLGQSYPAVVLEAGAGDDHSTWDNIQPAVAKFARVCSYDRTGRGSNSTASYPHTIQQMIDDLQALLIAIQLTPPYIFVGHSLGCLVLLLYAQQHPDTVAGVVLVDGPHPQQGERFTTALAAAGFSEHTGVQQILTMARGVDPGAHPDGVDFAASLAMLDPSFSLGDAPLVILTNQELPEQTFPDLPLAAAQAFQQAWQGMQAELIGLSINGAQITVAESGHYIHRDQPQIVIDAIRQVVDIVAGKVDTGTSGQRLES